MASMTVPVRDVSALYGGVKRVWRDRAEDAPIKKRVMASMKQTCRVKRDESVCDKASDLSLGLKHTLAQFTLSSRSSLGGPAAFSARAGMISPQALAPPFPSPSVLGAGPLLVPSDRSTELMQAMLEGESICSFVVGGEKRLCLPQVLNSVLRDFTLQQINAVCDQLYIYCARCDADQLHVLKVLGVLPFTAPSCGLITLTDAQRLCNALLRPGSARSHGVNASPADGQFGFQVEHRGLGKCRGVFVPKLYLRPDTPCVQCVECRLLFSPQNFVMHSHCTRDKRTCHWGFDSARWSRYLHLSRRYEGTAEETRLGAMLKELKEKFHQQSDTPADLVVDEDICVKKSNHSTDQVCDTKGKGSLALSCLCPDIKQEVGTPAIVPPSYFLYPYDKVVAPNVSLQKTDDGERGDSLLRQHYSRTTHDIHASTLSVTEEPKLRHVNGTHHPPAAVSVETSVKEQDNKEQLVCEMVDMYNKQQEKLNTTLHTQRELEMELHAVCDGEAERWRRLSVEHNDLQSELEAVHTEHAQKLGLVQQEQRELEQRLEQLRHTHCTCKSQEEQYTAQLCDLRVRLERAEAERQELQDELRREREARHKLELLISQLRQQITSSANHSSPSIYLTNHSPQSLNSDNHSPKQTTTANPSSQSQHTHTHHNAESA